jgi:hypothetical protein
MTNIARFSACIALALLSARVAARDEIHGYTLDPPVVVADAGDQILVQVTVRYTYGGSSGDKAHITAWVQRGGKPYSGVQPEVMPVERGPGTAKLYLWFDPATHKQKVQTTEIAFAFAATPKAADQFS